MVDENSNSASTGNFRPPAIQTQNIGSYQQVSADIREPSSLETVD